MYLEGEGIGGAELTHAAWRLAYNICCSSWSTSRFCRDRKPTLGLQLSAGKF